MNYDLSKPDEQDSSASALQNDFDTTVGNKEERKTAKLLYNKENTENVTLDQFEIVKKLGQGGCGKVYLVNHPQQQKLYALKCIRKDFVIEQEKGLEMLTAERDI